MCFGNQNQNRRQPVFFVCECREVRSDRDDRNHCGCNRRRDDRRDNRRNESRNRCSACNRRF